MNKILVLCYLFFIGSAGGWVLELIYRRFFSAANPERKWINPGFCVGPYLPLYGSGLCILYMLSMLSQKTGLDRTAGGQILRLVVMAVCMTAIEYIAGIGALKFGKIRLWDYTREWGNIQGIICPKFSLIWAGCSALYCYLIHPYILDALRWLSENLAFSFVIGFFFGVFTIDVVYSAQLVAKMKQFAEENQVIIRYESLKAHIRKVQDEARERSHFLLAFRTERGLAEHLKNAQEALEERIQRARTHR